MVNEGKSPDEIKKELKIPAPRTGKEGIALATISKRRIAVSWGDKRILTDRKKVRGN